MLGNIMLGNIIQFYKKIKQNKTCNYYHMKYIALKLLMKICLIYDDISVKGIVLKAFVC